MRSTQLQTLRAVAAESGTGMLLARRLGIPYSSCASRLRTLARDGFVSSVGGVYVLTDRARALLEARARIDGETP